GGAPDDIDCREGEYEGEFCVLHDRCCHLRYKFSQGLRYIYSPESINLLVQRRRGRLRRRPFVQLSPVGRGRSEGGASYFNREGGASYFIMIVIQNLVGIEKELAEPVYQQLANGIASLIRQGHLAPGSALPSSRKLAEMFEIHRKTVVAAF